MNEKTLRELLEKWHWRMEIASTSGGVNIAEHEAEEIWYLLTWLSKKELKP